MSYFPYTHIEPQITTIIELFQRPDNRESLFVNIIPKEFLDETILLGDGSSYAVRNRDLIFKKYSKADQVKYPTAEDIDENSPIKINTIFYVRDSNIKRDLLFTQTLNVVKTFSSNAFVSEKLKQLMSNPDYVRNYSSNNYINKVRKEVPQIQVFVWVRALSTIPQGSTANLFSNENLTGGQDVSDFFSGNGQTIQQNDAGAELEGSWLDITPFIERINTNVTETGGNFTFSVVPVVCTWSNTEGWVLDSFSVKGHINSNIQNSFTAKTIIQKIENNELKRNQFFFNNILSENDLVYIKFETLNIESSDRVDLQNKITINGSDIPSKYQDTTTKPYVFNSPSQERIYDMIGLIDVNNVNFNFTPNDITISIQGRDLVKTIIDDGTYFFPSEFAQGMFLAPGDADMNNSRLIKRNLFNGDLLSISIYNEKTIQNILQFIISQLTNTGLVPNSVFYAYQDRRNTTATLIKKNPLDLNNAAQKQKNLDLLFDSIAKYISEARLYYRSSNLEIGNNEYAGLTITPVNAIRKLVIDFAQFIINTDIAQTGYNSISSEFFLENWLPWISDSVFSSSFNNIVEKPSEAALKFSGIYPDAFAGYLFPKGDVAFREDLGTHFGGQVISISTSVTKSVAAAYSYLQLLNENNKQEIKTELLQGVWQIIDLLIDDSVKDRVLVDTSIAQEQGSLINTFNKVCVKPFVEFFTDTYGDRFVFIVRKPPFDEKSLLGMVYGSALSTEIDNSAGLDEDVDVDFLIHNQVVATTTNTSDAEAQTGIIIDIDEGDVQSENLSWYNGDVYSWYNLKPQGYLWGNAGAITWQFLPGIYFEEYSNIWGNKPYIVVTPYLPIKADKEAITAFKENNVLTQCYYDLKYLIDSTCYLPFTRQGSITLTFGDRRIKRGIFIRYKGTGEIFYVDAVSNAYNAMPIDRTTTIQVSRGMVEKYLKPQKIDGITNEVSYFNIINTNLNLSESQKITNINNDTPEQKEIRDSTNKYVLDNTPETVLKNFKVNKDVFNFFLQRRQRSE